MAISRSTSSRSAPRWRRPGDRHPALRTRPSRSSSGRWLVGEAGFYLTRIVDPKVSHGKTFLVTDGGMHHQLAAVGQFRPGDPPQLPRRHRQSLREAAAEERARRLPLHSASSRLADDVMLPRAMLATSSRVHGGAYGLSRARSLPGQQPASKWWSRGAQD
jgi:diaminopimelate decarboxylase